ncbi:unnamed protein product [Ostreobium quekettii]|uniref:Uncharacterized protein n=1 Tax=Ostreobium quekettii TaxID=121088 RepID=A0A8S1J0S9_9CHLO|nr:unnamed protein product [Ostreobium quekettii]
MSSGEGQEMQVVQQQAGDPAAPGLVPAGAGGNYMAAFPQQPLYAWPTDAGVPPSAQASPLHSEERMPGAAEARPQDMVDASAGGFFMEEVSTAAGTPSAALPVPAAPLPAPVNGSVACVVPPAAVAQPEPSPGVVSAAPPAVSLDDLRLAMHHFATERDWDKFHSPRNLLLAMVRDVGQLAEIFQWRGEVGKGLPGFTPEEKNRVSEELADILLYAIRLADVSGIDLGHAAYNKLHINSQKYPPPEYARTFETAARHKNEDEVGRKRQRERFSEEQVAAMTQLAERAGWSITAITWEERVKFCDEYSITKERLSNFFNNRKPKDLKKGRNRTPGQTPPQPQHTPSMDVQDVQQQPLQQQQPQHSMGGVHGDVEDGPVVAQQLDQVKVDVVDGTAGVVHTQSPVNDAQAQVPPAMREPATA